MHAVFVYFSSLQAAQEYDEVFEGTHKMPGEETMKPKKLEREDAKLEDELYSIAAHLEQAQKGLHVMQTALMSKSQDKDEAQKGRRTKERAGHWGQAARSQSVKLSRQQLQHRESSEQPLIMARRMHSYPMNAEFPYEQWSIDGLREEGVTQIQVNNIISCIVIVTKMY